MKISGFLFWYLLIPIAVALGLRVFLNEKKPRISRSAMPKICLRPTRWKVTLEE
ncbi:MAG: hypothetical protein IJ496_03510 [Ruminococcus sp.]|nr:hypothetical protein [Ruminococcus sp.]